MRWNLLILCLLLSCSTWAESTKILFLGDSLTAGYGVPIQKSYPSLLNENLKKTGQDVEIINAAESGSLSSSLLPKFKFYLKHNPPNILVIAIGGNDARKGTKPSTVKKNIATVVQLAKLENIKVLLCGMQIFPNYGPEYAKEFQSIYKDLAKEHHVHYLPFLLEGVAGKPEFNQTDGFHPNELGHARMAEHMRPYLEKLL